ncbi:FUSC family protein [Nocardioides zeae]|uniref:FUSC family protein n=1 Tax=Nocardioides imazamoxiresistens TaxID=3231893 RepID=A0ABU3PQF0_9ACTN|nr:FUSC family protein [Nocardioides zeae]MDT9591455.1 FUSC family protein [Nocardioides zeae]
MVRHVRTILGDVATFHPSPARRAVALRAAAAVGVPLATLAALGRPEWGLYAVFGAFAAIYGGSVAHRTRWRHQGFVGLLLAGATVSGAAVGVLDARAWPAVAVAAAWGVVAAHFSDRQRWLPPGPLFLVFAAGACAARPTQAYEVAAAAAVALGTTAWALLLGALEERRAAVDREPHHGRSTFPLHPERHRMHLVRVAAVVVVAGGTATLLSIPHPYWAMVAAVAPISVPRLRAQVARGVQRSAGTVVGVLLAAALLALDLPVWGVVLAATVLQSAAELTVTRNYAVAMVFITPLALLMGHLGHPEPVGAMVVGRLVETLLGVAVGIGAAWLTRHRPPAPAAPTAA